MENYILSTGQDFYLPAEITRKLMLRSSFLSPSQILLGLFTFQSN